MTTCPKCNYTRQPGDQAPDYECPQCGVVYAKYTPKPVPTPPPTVTLEPEGQSPAAKEEESKSSLWSTLTVLGMAAGVIYFFIQGQLSGPSSGEQNARYAYFHCQDLVKGRLKAPTSASFPVYPALPTNLGDGGLVVIRSYVDAQNSFGAMLRTNFRCKLQYTGGDAASGAAWKFVELTMPFAEFNTTR